MITVAAALRLPRRLAGFIADRRAASTVEFAITLPLLLGIYLGSSAVGQGVVIKRKVTLTAHTVADLTSQQTAVSAAEMANIFNAAAAIMAPYPSANLQAVVAEVAIDGQGQATVVWSSASQNGTALTAGQSVTVPSALAVPNTYLILGQAQYSYDPTYASALTNTVTLSDQIFVLPRQSASIPFTGS